MGYADAKTKNVCLTICNGIKQVLKAGIMQRTKFVISTFLNLEFRPACGNIALLTVESKSIDAQHLHESCYQPNVKFNYSYLFSIIFN